jgi:hypothetical protein
MKARYAANGWVHGSPRRATSSYASELLGIARLMRAATLRRTGGIEVDDTRYAGGSTEGDDV